MEANNETMANLNMMQQKKRQWQCIARRFEIWSFHYKQDKDHHLKQI
jgi:hypothetical protein